MKKKNNTPNNNNDQKKKEKQPRKLPPLKPEYHSFVISDDPVTNPYDLKKISASDILPREFFRQDVVTLAQELLGKYLVRETKQGIIKCMIVETEAYKAPCDKGCHAYNGRKTDRNKSFWLDGGHAYMYSIYGANYCFNVVASSENNPEAVLVRAVEPIEGIEIIRKNRTIQSKKNKELTGGPAKFTQAMEIDLTFDGVDLTKKGSLYIIKGNRSNFQIDRSKRININYAEDWINKLWRFTIRGNEYISV